MNRPELGSRSREMGIRVRQQKTDPPGGWIGDVPAATKGSYPSIGSFQHVESSESWVPRLATFRRTLRLRLGQYISLAFAAATIGVDLRGCEPATSRHWGGRSWTRTRDLSLIRTAL